MKLDKTREILDFSAEIAAGQTVDMEEEFFSDAILEEFDLQFQGGVVNTVKVYMWLEKDVEGGKGLPVSFIKHKNASRNFLTGDDQQLRKTIYYPAPKRSVLKIKIVSTAVNTSHVINLLWTVRYKAVV